MKEDIMGKRGRAPPGSMRMKKSRTKRVIGVVETVTVKGKTGKVTVLAKIDTGASRTTVDTGIAARIGLGPILDTVRIRVPTSRHAETRPLVDADLIIAGEEFDIAVAVTSRREMKYRVIIGMDILGLGKFLVNPAKGARANEIANGVEKSP